MGLASHCNVYNTCLSILVEKGYALRVTGEIEEEGHYPTRCFWIAERDAFYFCADNPIELLGLVAVREHLEPAEDVPYWWRTEGPEWDSDLKHRAFGECKFADGTRNS